MTQFARVIEILERDGQIDNFAASTIASACGSKPAYGISEPWVM
jgi:hypothetical protein